MVDNRDNIIQNIIEITDYDNNKINIDDIRIEFSCNKYSSKKNSIYRIILNDNYMTKRIKYNFKYRCFTCDSVHVVGTTQFLRKVNKCSLKCNMCCNKDVAKREQHKEFFRTRENNITTHTQQKSLIEIKNESERLFEEYGEDFRENYFNNHLSDEDYSRISKNIVSIQNGKYLIDNLQFWPIFKTNNNMLFSSIFYDTSNNIVLRANQPIMRCDNCGNTWRAKMLERYKKYHKIMCNDCTLCNKTFKIRSTKNIQNDNILFQSQLELKFIKWCENSNIVVENGPNIPYQFEKKDRIYRVDFQIDDILIEIKDNHIWHHNQVQSGKWKQKEESVYQEIAKGKYKKYYMITPKTWVYSLNKIKELTK